MFHFLFIHRVISKLVTIRFSSVPHDENWSLKSFLIENICHLSPLGRSENRQNTIPEIWVHPCLGYSPIFIIIFCHLLLLWTCGLHGAWFKSVKQCLDSGAWLLKRAFFVDPDRRSTSRSSLEDESLYFMIDCFVIATRSRSLITCTLQEGIW